MATVSFQISNLLEKMTSTDKDFRFMATNDLMAELQKDSIKLDDDSERKIVKMLLKLLEDKNGEVQNLAVKCLGPLVNKVKEHQVEVIVDTLCNNMISDKEQLRDISSIGLKTVISELPQSSSPLAASVCKKITGKLTNIIALQQQKDVTVQLEALDILADLLSRFGNLLISFHVTVQETLIPQLSSSRLAVCKRSITAISYLLMTCNQTLFSKTIEQLLEKLTSLQQKYQQKSILENNMLTLIRTYIQCIAAISRQAGHRFGEHFEKIFPIIQNFSSYDDYELKEYCLQAFESFVRRCPKEMTAHIASVKQICLKYICYDPNYNYDDVSVEEMEMDNSDSNDDEEEYSDDDDMSWKVRRAAAKCLEAIISSRHDMIEEFYSSISPALIGRFKEREETVKGDIFSAYNSLLKQTRPVNKDENSVAIMILQNQVPNIVKSLHKQLREKSIKTRQGSFALLTELIDILPGCLAAHTECLIPGILYSLSDVSSNIKIDALTFLNSFLKRHPPEIFHPHIQVLLPAITTAVNDSFYKISSEALVVLTQMVCVIRPTPLKDQNNFKYDNYVQMIYDCTYMKLQASDIDQEVKERAITCMGQVISTFGDIMAKQVSITLPLLVDRLRNEITRLTCVKALTKIASSQFKIELTPFLHEAIPILASFLRKNQRTLKLSTLILLDTLVNNYGEHFTNESVGTVLNEAPPLISENDLHISQLTLSLLTSLTRSHKAFLPIIPQKILPETLLLLRSPLLQGVALQSVLDFFQSIVRSSFPGLDYNELVRQLTLPISINNNQSFSGNLSSSGSSNSSSNAGNSGTGGYPLHKQAYHSIAKCIAAISILDNRQSLSTVKQFMNELKTQPISESKQVFALLAIGEIGKHIDCTSINELKDVLVETLLSSSEEVKSAASFALGSIAVGNLKVYLPFILQQIEIHDKRQYLLLHSLKEVITCQSINASMIQALEPHLNSIWSLLLNHCQCPEEGTRNVVAECLGKLTLMKPNELLPTLRKYLDNQSPLARSTIVTAVKFTISDQPQPIDSLLRSAIGDFLETLQDRDINVRRVALVAFNSAAHNKPSLIRDLLDKILPQLYNETKIREDLIREVEMGPFKHTVDDGLDIRKAAFECMYTLLDSCLDRIDIFEFLNHVENGLRDHYDVKMLTYLMLVRLSHLCPSAVINRLDRLVEPLRATCSSKAKPNAVKQESEKQDELKRSAMRALLALINIPDADKNMPLTDFVNQIKMTPELNLLFEQIQRDANTVNDSTSAMDTN